MSSSTLWKPRLCAVGRRAAVVGFVVHMAVLTRWGGSAREVSGCVWGARAEPRSCAGCQRARVVSNGARECPGAREPPSADGRKREQHYGAIHGASSPIGRCDEQAPTEQWERQERGQGRAGVQWGGRGLPPPFFPSPPTRSSP
eukprot:scaffold148363_cov28-Tisochrysis_lutea.AAC.1